MRPLKPEEAKLWHLVGKTTKAVRGERHKNQKYKGVEHFKLQQLENLLNNKPQTQDTPKNDELKIYIKPKIKKPEKKILIPKPVADISNEKKIRRGKVEIQNTIDLHGMTQTVAESALVNFILTSYANQVRNLLVITGKGVNIAHHNHEPFDMFAPSKRGVLRQKLYEWLNKPDLRKYIAGVSEANQKHGGSGAYYVRLKAKI